MCDIPDYVSSRLNATVNLQHMYSNKYQTECQGFSLQKNDEVQSAVLLFSIDIIPSLWYTLFVKEVGVYGDW